MNDEELMRRALTLAARGFHSTSPNPMVGCVIAHDGSIVAEGFHERAGEPHAEVNALDSVADLPSGSSLYVTLEPCSHTGRTPPCTEAILRSGIRRVVIAMTDPDPRVSGSGIRMLRERGVEVELGLCGDEAQRLNEKFSYAMRSGKPFVLLKAGMSLDGKLATVERESRWITSDASRQRSLELREEYDAILVGSGTVGADDPQLTRRLGINRSINPWTRVVLDADGSLPRSARLLHDGGRTIVYTTRDLAKTFDGIASDVVAVDASDGRLDLAAVLEDLGRREMRSLLVEGGSLVHSDFIRRRLWQKMILFIAPMLLGGGEAPSIFLDGGVEKLADAHRFRFDLVERIGSDLVVTAYPEAS